ncbi:MAG: glutathione-regulated potassium-efflux system protein KefB [Rhizobiales bacterium]|nr:glutathione-regulated potassium-efflux system protein KefB [Hyphomicrobiales bacterium]
MLLEAVVYLAAAVFAAPAARLLRIGSVLGYLAAGVLIGPFGLGFVYGLYEVKGILHFAELGVVMLLFLIGLELKPRRLWSMRRSVFGGGAMQLVPTTMALLAAGLLFGVPIGAAVILAMALSLSSTAFVLQILEERRELQTRHGRLSFAILLLQDIAAIPMIALVAALGARTQGMDAVGAIKGIAIVAAVVGVGHYVLPHIYRLVASSGVRESMTATALLTVVGVALLMEMAGLSAALGAFLAGLLLAESEFRHQIQADIQPFEGLLLGLFFTAIGMTIDFRILAQQPTLVLLLVVGLVAVKGVVLYATGRQQGLSHAESRRLAVALAQGGEFAFVIMTSAVGGGLLDRKLADLLTLVVTISMALTPLLLVLEERLRRIAGKGGQDEFESMPEADSHVVIAGFGRFAQIVARILKAKGIPFTALEASVQQVKLVRAFGSEAYYGDTSRLDILNAANTRSARAFVLAVDDVERSLKTAEVMRTHFPHVPVYARAHDREHAHKLMDLGVHLLQREAFHSAVALAHDVLRGLGISEREARRTVETFAAYDQRRLIEEHEHYQDAEKLREGARKATADLEKLFREDAEVEQALAAREDR